MPSRPNPFDARLSALVGRIYPEADQRAICRDICEAFWPEGAHRRKRARAPSNRLWSEQDAVLITYGNSIIDGTYKPLDLLEDFLTYALICSKRVHKLTASTNKEVQPLSKQLPMELWL